MAWICALKNKSSMNIENIHNKRICSAHFFSGRKASCLDGSNIDWAPSLLLISTLTEPDESLDDVLPNTTPPTEKLEFDSSVIQEENIEIRKIVESIDVHHGSINEAKKMPENVSLETQHCISHLHAVIDIQSNIIKSLEEKLLKYKLNLESFRGDDVRTLYYTGLPEFVVLEELYNQIEPYIRRHKQNCLAKSQMLILTLMKLRLGLPFKDLSYRFDISPPTASRIFYHVVDVLYYRLYNLVFVPNRDDVKLTMPEVFKVNFGEDVVYIIDCTEIFIETPSNPETSVQCYSFYKKHHTVKFLIAITPQGSIVFVSNLIGGRASDIFITNMSWPIKGLKWLMYLN